MPPTAILNSLQTVRRKVKVLSVVYGAGIVLASAVGLLLAVVLVDYLLNLHSFPRLLAMLLSLGGLGYLGYRFIVQPALTRLSLSDVAGRLENVFPEFEDRLRSTVNFNDSNETGSDIMRQRVIEQAGQIAGKLNLSSAVIAKPAVLSMTGAIASIFFIGLIAGVVLDRSTLSIITSRLFTPFNAQNWPKSVLINMLTSTPKRVPVGQKIDVKMKLDRGDKASVKPILYYQVDGGPLQQMFMTRGADGQFHASLDARLEQQQQSGTLHSWIVAGDDRHDLDSVAIVPRLQIKSIIAHITPPAYVTDRTVGSVNLSASPAIATEGSDLSVEVTFNKSLSSADPTLEVIGNDIKAPQVAWKRSSAEIATASWAANQSMRFRVRASDNDDFSNTALEEYEVVVHPDAMPSIQIEEPRRSDSRTARAFVNLQAVTEDDNGINDVTLRVERLAPRSAKWEIPLISGATPVSDTVWNRIDGSADRLRNRLNYKWEIANLKDADLKPGDVLEYHLQARDNYNLAGKMHDPVISSKLRVTIVSEEDFNNSILDTMRETKTAIGTVRSQQNRTNEETKTLADQTKDKDKLDNADRAVTERLANQQSSTAAATKTLSQRMDDINRRMEENRSDNKDLKELANEVKDRLDRASEGPMKDSTNDLNKAGENKDKPDDRNKDLNDAKDNQDKALKDLDTVMARMENIGSLSTAINTVNGLLKDQKDLRKSNEELAKNNLGKRPDQMSPEDRKKLDDTAKKQEELADKTQKAIDKMADQAKQMEKSDPSASEAMSKAADQGKASRVPSKQQKASDETKDNKQANAQQSQQQAELGLEQMLNELKEAERRELAKLQEQLASLQQQTAGLIRRQSGHNLDNILIQGPAKLGTINPKLLTELTEKADRKPEEVKAPALSSLASGQQLTETNTRSLAKAADNNPKTAEFGSSLVKAAGSMERANVFLRDQKVVEAYDPPQVDALTTLEQLKKKIDEKKNEVDNKIENQKKEAIRAHYVRVKEAQDKLNTETIAIEKSRDTQGELKRPDAIKLGQLPDRQADLSKEITAIGEDLKSQESVVYDWANKDIGKSMDEVRDDLKGTKTGVPTQAEQKRIMDQLIAMIDNLKEDQKDKKFESGGGGGGGGKPPKPKIPTVAELRMLKSLQQAINSSTRTIDAEKSKDQPKLLGLGNRQGELRNLLGEMIKKATQGQSGLSPEPDNKDQLPEEANQDDVDTQELSEALLAGNASQKQVDQTMDLVATRMARSRQRLAINTDPGKITQVIQDKILTDLDKMIEAAKKNQQGGGSGQPQPGDGQSPKPNDDQQQAQNQGKNQQSGQPSQSTEGATNTHNAGAGSAVSGKDIRETAAEWGNVPPRLRDPIVESKNEAIVEQYRKLIEDYYEALSTKATKK